TEYAEAGIDTTGSILPGEVTGEIVSKLGTGVRVVGAVYKKTTLAYAVQGLVQSEVEELVNKVTEKLYQFLEEQIHSFRSPSDAITFAEYCHQKLQYIMAEYPKMKVNNEFPLTHGYTREQQMDIYAQRLLEKLTTPNES